MSAHEIRDLIDEIAKLSQSDLQPTEFYDQVLGRLTMQLRAAGTAAWMCSGDTTDLLCQRVNEGVSPLNGELVSEDHQQLLAVVQDSGQPNLFRPGALGPNDNFNNPTEYALGICPVKVGDQVVALLESFHPAVGNPEQQQAGLKLLTIVAGVATNFHRNLELRWRRGLDKFSSSIHKSLHPLETAFNIANDGRPVVGCDRLSVVVKRGRRCRLEAVSGVESVHRRANETRLMENLSRRVLATGEALTYPNREEELPPQIDDAVHEYVDESQTKLLTLIPLVEQPKVDDEEEEVRKKKPEILGALIAEQFSGAPFLPEQLEVVGAHASRALKNSMDHDRIFLLPLWRAIGSMSWLIRARTLPWTIVVSALIIGLILAAIFVPADFKITAEGTLQPQDRRNIFAPEDGDVDTQDEDDGLFETKHAAEVTQGQPLVRIKSPNLEKDLLTIESEIIDATKALDNAEKSLAFAKPEDIDRYEAEVESNKEKLIGLDAQKALIQSQLDKLIVTCPLRRGIVTTWDIKNRLLARPVKKGQTLLTIANVDGEWVLELLLPDRRWEHLKRAQKEFGEELEVSFILATDPGTTIIGTIEPDGVAKSTKINQEEGLAMLVRVAIDEKQIPSLRPGAEVVGRIHCGKRSIGYVWLHDVFEFVQARILFRYF